MNTDNTPPTDEDDELAFVHLAPLRPRDIMQEDWPEHPILRWLKPTTRDGRRPLINAPIPVHISRMKEVRKIPIRRDKHGRTFARVPPRMNYDWFLHSGMDESETAPILGRARDCERWYLPRHLATYMRESAAQNLQIDPETDIRAFGVVRARTVDGIRTFAMADITGWTPLTLADWERLRNDTLPVEGICRGGCLVAPLDTPRTGTPYRPR